MLNDHQANKPKQRGRWGIGWRFNRNARTLFLGPGNRFVIGAPGNPMMQRWRLLQTPLFGVYVHFIYREDLDPVPHDHPWRFWSLVLRGGYVEHLWPDSRVPEVSEIRHRLRGYVHAFPLRSCHRIVAVQPRTVTLVLVGRKVRTWGFYDHRRGNAFVDWRDALGIRPTEGARSTGKYSGGTP